MKAIHKEKVQEVPVSEALDTLAEIRELELASTVEQDLLEKPEGEDIPLVLKAIRWLHQKNAERILHVIKTDYQVILAYLQQFLAHTERPLEQESIDRIQNIMLLAGDAAENLDHYTSLFMGTLWKSAKESKEFKDLCLFYNKKIGKGTPFLKKEQVEKTPILSEDLDLEAVKRDKEYELIFLRKENGTRFITRELLNKIKLLCDVEGALEDREESYIEKDIKEIEKDEAESEISYIRKDANKDLDSIIHMAHMYKDQRLVQELFQAIIALMMASIPQSSKTKQPDEYFHDFKELFTILVHDKDFQRLVTYPPKNKQSWESLLLQIAEHLAWIIVQGAPLSSLLVQKMDELVTKGAKEGLVKVKGGSISERLSDEYLALKYLHDHEDTRVLSSLLHHFDEDPSTIFEPLMMMSMPHHLFDLSWHKQSIPFVELPAPIHQEYIHKASSSEIFQLALRYLKSHESESKVLIINIQDRTSWQEGARAKAVEDITYNQDLRGMLDVVTFSKEGEFFTQTGSFSSESDSQNFIDNLLDHALKETYGAFWKKTECLPKTMKLLAQAILKTFFKNQKELPQHERKEFIELFYTFLIVVAVDAYRPDIVFITSKDGLDNCLPEMSKLFFTLKLIHKRIISEMELKWHRAYLYGLTLSIRERLPLEEKLFSLFSAVHRIEKAQEDKGEPLFHEFDNVFSQNIQSATLTLHGQDKYFS